MRKHSCHEMQFLLPLLPSAALRDAAFAVSPFSRSPGGPCVLARSIVFFAAQDRDQGRFPRYQAFPLFRLPIPGVCSGSGGWRLAGKIAIRGSLLQGAAFFACFAPSRENRLFAVAPALLCASAPLRETAFRRCCSFASLCGLCVMRSQMGACWWLGMWHDQGFPRANLSFVPHSRYFWRDSNQNPSNPGTGVREEDEGWGVVERERSRTEAASVVTARNPRYAGVPNRCRQNSELVHSPLA